MVSRIQQKIEYICRQPEHVKMRYLFLCLGVSMLFIVTIWLISLNESFRRISNQSSESLNLPDIPPGKTAPSLGDLLEQRSPLRVEEGKTSEEGYFEEQVKAREGDASAPTNQ